MIKMGAHDYLKKDNKLFENLQRTVTNVFRELASEKKLADMEKALIDREKLLSSIFNTVPMGICVLDEQGYYISVNNTYCNIYDYSEEELIGQSFTIVSAPEIRNLQMQLHRDFINGIPYPTKEFKAQRNDGSSVFVNIENSLLKQDDGHRYRISVVTDITEHKRTRETLSQLAAIVECSDDAIISNSLDGVIMSWNAGAEKLYGFSAKEVIGKPISILYPPNQQDDLPQILKKIQTGDSISHFETQRKTKDGRIVDISLTISPIINAEDLVIGASSIARDITKHKKNEEALRQSEDKFRSLTRETPNGICLIDEQGYIIEWNTAYEEITGIPREAALGRTVWDINFLLLPLEDRTPNFIEHSQTRVLDILQGNLGEEGLAPYSLTIYRPDGKTRIIERRRFLIKTKKGNQLGNLVIDVTERKLAEQMLVENEKLASLGTLAAGIAHEINTPLQVITGISESLTEQMGKDDFDKDRMKRQLEMVNRNAWRIAEIIKSMLTYVRTESKRMEVHNLNQIVKETTRLIEHQLKSWSNISIEMDLMPDLPPISCNQGQIGQVLINLLTNARDAMPVGGTITIRTGIDHSQRVFLQVTDQGEGIPEEIRGKIFDPFFTTKPIGKGTGIGLSILSGTVRSHGGEIIVESQPKQGTAFIIIFPSLS
jgi:PAS domain S-box-containing protein